MKKCTYKNVFFALIFTDLFYGLINSSGIQKSSTTTIYSFFWRNSTMKFLNSHEELTLLTALMVLTIHISTLTLPFLSQ